MAVEQLHPSEMNTMAEHGPKPVDEPVGIVISNGKRPAHSPRFVAYIWAQESEPAGAPDAELQPA
jgi:hypothetical protein